MDVTADRLTWIALSCRCVLLRVAIVLAGATVLALLFACQGYVMYLRQGNALPFSTLFAVALVDWWAWAAFLPGLAWLTGRLPVPRSRWLRWTLLLLLVGAAVAAAKMLVNSLLRAAIFDYTMFPLPLAAMWTHLLTFGAIVGFLYARSAARLSALLGRAQLQLLADAAPAPLPVQYPPRHRRAGA